VSVAAGFFIFSSVQHSTPTPINTINHHLGFPIWLSFGINSHLAVQWQPFGISLIIIWLFFPFHHSFVILMVLCTYYATTFTSTYASTNVYFLTLLNYFYGFQKEAHTSKPIIYPILLGSQILKAFPRLALILWPLFLERFKEFGPFFGWLNLPIPWKIILGLKNSFLGKERLQARGKKLPWFPFLIQLIFPWPF